MIYLIGMIQHYALQIIRKLTNIDIVYFIMNITYK